MTVLVTVMTGDMDHRKLPDSIPDRMATFLECQDVLFSEGITYLVELATTDDVNREVEEALAKANDGDAILFLCSQDSLVDSVVQLFNVDPDNPLHWPERGSAQV